MLLFLKWALAIAAVGYLATLAVLYVTQRSLEYFPETFRTAPAAAGLPQAEDNVLDTPDGERIIVWHVPPGEKMPVVLYLHGNGGALSHRAMRFAALTAGGIGLVAVDYRGYGGSSGRPTERGLIIDAETAYDFAFARYPVARLAVWGKSLGTGVATALAAERPVGRLILEAPFTSTADIAGLHYPYVPVHWLMKDQFRSDERIGSVKAPLLVMHGVRDPIVPIQFGERLFALAHEPKRFIRYPEGEHEDLDRFGATQAVKAFLAEAAGPGDEAARPSAPPSGVNAVSR